MSRVRDSKSRSIQGSLFFAFRMGATKSGATQYCCLFPSSTRNAHLVPVLVQPLDDFQMAVPRREDHGVHGASFRAATAEELEEFQVPTRGCVVDSGSGAPLSAILV